MGQLKIYNFLKANKGTWFNANNLADVLSMTKPQIFKYLGKMGKFPGIYNGLIKKDVLETREGDVTGIYTVVYYSVEKE